VQTGRIDAWQGCKNRLPLPAIRIHIGKGKRLTFNDLTYPISLIETRRSGKPRDMIEPGPDSAQLDRILAAAMRVPDHGKLAPWRFVVIDSDKREAFATILRAAYLEEKPEAGRLELEALEQFATQSPTLVIVVSAPASDSKIPLWEQQLSAGAACTMMLHAAHALGFVGSWLTGWPAYSKTIEREFGGAGDRIAGFVFMGSPGRSLSERPRPEFEAVVSHWPGKIEG